MEPIIKYESCDDLHLRPTELIEHQKMPEHSSEYINNTIMLNYNEMQQQFARNNISYAGNLSMAAIGGHNQFEGFCMPSTATTHGMNSMFIGNCDNVPSIPKRYRRNDVLFSSPISEIVSKIGVFSNNMNLILYY